MNNFNKRTLFAPGALMKNLYLLLFLGSGPLFAGGTAPGSPHPGCLTASFSDSTGIEGIAYTVSGNRMPSPDLRPGPRQLVGIKATVTIFELTNSSQVVQVGQSPCYTAVNTKLVRQEDTDEKGHFSVLLAPGRYSVFTKKGGLFCAGRRDDKNNIAPVDVVAGKMTWVECRVETNHKAVY
jgi:hypothetical protein